MFLNLAAVSSILLLALPVQAQLQRVFCAGQPTNLAQLGGTFGQYVTDHGTVKIARLLHDQLPAAIANLDSMPRRP